VLLNGSRLAASRFYWVWVILVGPVNYINGRVKELSATKLLSAKERLDSENALRTTLAQIIGGLVLLIGLYFTHRNVKIAERNSEIARDGQLTDRYTKAIEQFASDQRSTRLGAIYALERIAAESPQDHWPIVEVFLAYVDETSQIDREIAQVNTGYEDDDAEPTPEIRAILRALGRRSEEAVIQQKLALSNLDLRGLDIEGANFEGTILTACQLCNGNLSNSRLDFADLERANAYGCDLTGARLREANLHRVLANCANLSRVRAEGANLSQSRLYRANLENGDFKRCDFTGAHLTEASLAGADLRGSILDDADFENAILSGADLRSTDLSNTRNLSVNQIKTAKTDGRTLMPTSTVPVEPPSPQATSLMP